MKCAAAIVILIPLGLLCRFVPLGLPYVIVKYGGSFLWAATVYWTIAFILARRLPPITALFALAITAAVEFIKRIPSANLDEFRGTAAGKVLLGRHFSYTDIVVYWLAILCALWIDSSAIHGRLASNK